MREGTIVYYQENNTVYSGKITDIERKGDDFLFSIEGYGSCEGPYRISSAQIGRTVFLTKEEAEEFR